MPTGVVSGRRQICLLIVGVHHLARLLAHLHMSLHVCCSKQILRIPLSYCKNMTLTYNISYALKLAIYTKGMLGHHIQIGLWFITMALLWRAGDWAETANMAILSRRPRAEVMSLSVMNHSPSPEGPPSLFLKSYIILLLQGRPAFNIVMILLCKVMHLVWSHPCMHKLFLYHVETVQDTTSAWGPIQE